MSGANAGVDHDAVSLCIWVAIPCHNEQNYIGPVVQRCLEHVSAVLVIDDGSTDRTAEVAQRAGARVIRHDRNRGYGKAIHSAVQAALEGDADVLITLDGDGQHDPDELPSLLEPLLRQRADLVIGSRFLGQPLEVPRYRRVGIHVITAICNLAARAKVSDAQSGFRAYHRQVLESLALTDTGMAASVEILIQAIEAGARVSEVPITCRYHEDSSSQHPILHGVGVALRAARYRLNHAPLSQKLRRAKG